MNDRASESSELSISVVLVAPLLCYTKAASSFSAQASTAVYGDSTHQMTKSASSVAAQGTCEAARQLDDAKDYIYSTWDNKLRLYLVEKGVLAKDTEEKKHTELLALMRDAYARATTPFWQAWSTSYMREWLIAHELVAPDAPPPTTEVLKAQMAQYFYDVNDRVWRGSSPNIVKSDAQVKREKLVKLMEDNYLNAKDMIFSAWSDSQTREWLVEHGVTNVPAKRDELVKLMQSKYNDAAGANAEYLVFPDARLRAYLRNRGIDESALPTSRPGLLQEARIRWVQAQTTFERIREIVNSGVEATEEKPGRLLEMLAGEGEKAKAGAKASAKKGKDEAKKGKENVQGKASGEL
ncbi:hypothetical protein DFH07DRAFT_971070 [Mycena maculata]|uniref:Uncharacterized protein n=1 Tax=Mycena maculata TaxID=230809 RepID=A0AAD7HNW9_9AGAR|nr:hypothetical protein DFH07DRAFT_971070 [Mycena maculata]